MNEKFNRSKYDTQEIQTAIQRIKNIQNSLFLIWQQHMIGNPNFTRGMVDKVKLIVEQFLESKGIKLDYKNPPKISKP